MPDRIFTVRCSALDLLWQCAESIDRPDGALVVSPANEMADLGTAQHRAAESLGVDSEPDLADIASRFGVDLDELSMLWAMTLRQWNGGEQHPGLKTWFADGDTECQGEHVVEWPHHSYTHFRLRGKRDRRAIRGNRVYGLDWKTGYVEADHEHQMRGYGFLDMLAYPEAEQIWSGIAYVRLGFIDAKIYTRRQLEDWFADLLTHLANQLGTYAPGPHCRFCDRQHDCAGRDRWMQSAIVAFGSNLRVPIEGPPEMIGPQLAELLRTAKAVGGACDRVRDVAREYADAHDGFFPTGDGRAFELRTTKRRSIDPAAGWPVLSQHLTDGELAPCVKISKGAVEKAIGAKTERGGKGKAIEALMDELDAAGALREQPMTQLREVKADV